MNVMENLIIAVIAGVSFGIFVWLISGSQTLGRWAAFFAAYVSIIFGRMP
jgi:hypothetical protein